jgi:cardiolipin synthase
MIAVERRAPSVPTVGRPSGAVQVTSDGIEAHAERLLSGPVTTADLALAFEESTAATTELLVEGTSFYPRMLEDIASATSSVHLNQFGFKPGAIGDEVASVLAAKARSGVPVRLVVDGRGSDPDRQSLRLYTDLAAAGVTVCVVRAMKLRTRSGPIDAGGPMRWNLHGLGHFDHRKLLVVDGRIGWVGGAGIEDHFQDGRFHDVFVRVTGPVVHQLQLVFLASLRWLGGHVLEHELEPLFPVPDAGADPVPAVVLHNAPGLHRPITWAITEIIEGASSTLDITNPYIADRGMINRIADAARRGVAVRLFVPADANNWACAAAQQYHHATLLDAGVRMLEYPAMLHAKVFVGDATDVLIGTCNLEAWSLKRFFEIDVRVRSHALAAQFEERFAAPAELISGPGRRISGVKPKARATLFAAISPLL